MTFLSQFPLNFLDYAEPEFEEIAVAAVLIVWLVIFAYTALIMLLIAYAVASYVLNGIGLQTIARRRGIQKAWTAWIPCASSWLLGSISDQYQYLVKGKIRTRRKMMLGLSIAVFALYEILFTSIFTSGMWAEILPLSGPSVLISFISFFGFWAAVIALSVYQYICFYDLFRSCRPRKKVGYLLLSIFLGAAPLLVFLCRNKDNGMPPRKRAKLPAAEPAQPEVTEDAAETEVTEEAIAEVLEDIVEGTTAVAEETAEEASEAAEKTAEEVAEEASVAATEETEEERRAKEAIRAELGALFDE